MLKLKFDSKYVLKVQRSIYDWIILSTGTSKDGVSQIEKEFAKRFGLPFAGLLKRVRDTKSQVKLDRSKRRENIKNAFALNSEFIRSTSSGHNSKLRNANIFLVDDVLTTGATLSEAGKVLRKAGANKVWGIALAKEK
ncbi:MAG: phosphoribosyltransferase family protein [Patescibacteria group bacterium]